VKNFKELQEGFANRLRGGKVPVGLYRFKYVTKGNPKFIENSGTRRGMEVIETGKDYVILNGDANSHSSLVDSLQRLGDVDGYVEDA